jgi:hypothetical protein
MIFEKSRMKHLQLCCNMKTMYAFRQCHLDSENKSFYRKIGFCMLRLTALRYLLVLLSQKFSFLPPTITILCSLLCSYCFYNSSERESMHTFSAHTMKCEWTTIESFLMSMWSLTSHERKLKLLKNKGVVKCGDNLFDRIILCCKNLSIHIYKINGLFNSA